MRSRFVFLGALVCCSSSLPTAPAGTVIAKLAGGYQFVVDDDTAYVAGGNGQNGTGIVRVPLDGGATSMMIVTNTDLALALDESAIYFTFDGVARIDKDGGPSQTITDAAAEGVALDDAFVYWRTQHAIARVGKDGGANETVTTTPKFIGSFVVDDVNVYWSEVAVDAGLSLANVLRVSKDGGAPETLAADVSPISPLAIDDGGVYWATIGALDQGSITRFDKATSTTATLATGNDCLGPGSITTGASSVFWSGIEHISTPGPDGGARYVVRTSTSVPDIHVHNATIYWLDDDYDAGVTNLRAIPVP